MLEFEYLIQTFDIVQSLLLVSGYVYPVSLCADPLR